MSLERRYYGLSRTSQAGHSEYPGVVTFLKPHCLNTGIPQGSVLGPLLFSMYMTSLGSVLRKHGFFYHCFNEQKRAHVTSLFVRLHWLPIVAHIKSLLLVFKTPTGSAPPCLHSLTYRLMNPLDPFAMPTNNGLWCHCKKK